MINTGNDTVQQPCCVNKLLICVKRACSCMSNNLRFHILKEGNYEFEELFQERSVVIKTWASGNVCPIPRGSSA